MKVMMIWPKCNLLNGHWCYKKHIDSFWVECTCEEAENFVLPFCKEEQEICCGSPHFHDHWKKSLIWEAIEKTKQSIKENLNLLGEDKLFYFLISRDLASIQVFWWGYPYSGQWNAYSPFIAVSPEITIENLGEMKDIKLPDKAAMDVVLNSGAIIATLILKADGKTAKNLIEVLSGELIGLKEKGINISAVSIKNVPDGYYSEDIEMLVGDLLMCGYAKQGDVFKLTEEGKDICKRLINEELENDKTRRVMEEMLILLGIPFMSVVK